MALEIRAVAPEEHELYGHTISAAFGYELRPEDVERWRHILPPGRDLGAFEGAALVGTATSFPLELTVPGGRQPAAGVTGVGVLPSHRRRGIMTELMRRQLDDLHGRSEPLAVLWASEGSIYGRFGYGLASRNARVACERDRMAFREPASAVGTVRLLTAEEAIAALPDVYDRVCAVTPGFFTRSEAWWRWHRLHDPERERDGGGPMFRAALELDGRLEAYALYRVHQSWESGVPAGRVEVLEEVSTCAEATREIWRFLLGIDLVRAVRWRRLPADHPLFLLVTEPARLHCSQGDGLWLRLLDVEAALAGRSYASSESVVLEVADSFCPWNEGRWLLDPSAGRTRVERTSQGPDILLDVADLASAYLGGFTFAELRRAGRVEELVPGALERADALFRTDRAPWCPEGF